ncbi:subtilisin-like protein [Lactarius psammicola]|nr:subtilisin-like protein [Lactarius psammicola]
MLVRYHLFSVLSVLATVFLYGQATPLTRLWDNITMKHSWNAVPDHWESLGHPAAGTTIDLYLALKSHNEDALVDALYKVSTPKHPKYGAHLSKEQVADLVAPHPDTLELVTSWLEDRGIPPSSVSMTLGGNWLKVIGVPVLQANDILGASYQLYLHGETNGTVLRTVSYSLPGALHGHIQTVVPTTYFGSPRMEWKQRPNGVAAARIKAGLREHVTVLPSREDENFVSPSYVRWLYKTTGYVPTVVDMNEIGIAGFRGQYPNPEDLQEFMKEYRTDGEYATYRVEGVNGGLYNPSEPGAEANLNLQFAEAITYPTPNIFYSIGGVADTETDPYVKWVEYLLKQTRIPQTISTSYGGYEHDFSPEYAKRVCDLFAQLGARGVTVLFGSGDWGVGEGDCLVEDDDNPGHETVAFLPIFPATCPHVTSVGGTVGGTTIDDPEVAAIFSGGGFSNYFVRPSYQAKVVPDFLQKIDNMYDGFYNRYGRGIPDISAQAVKFKFILNMQPTLRSGTSGSTPIVAGIISLLNDYRISKGISPFGFLNPWLYSDGLTGIKDITAGWNPGCGTDGFPAVVGWDPVTGLGTPNFDKLEEIIDDLPPVQPTVTSLPTGEGGGSTMVL